MISFSGPLQKCGNKISDSFALAANNEKIHNLAKTWLF